MLRKTQQDSPEHAKRFFFHVLCPAETFEIYCEKIQVQKIKTKIFEKVCVDKIAERTFLIKK